VDEVEEEVCIKYILFCLLVHTLIWTISDTRTCEQFVCCVKIKRGIVRSSDVAVD